MSSCVNFQNTNHAMQFRSTTTYGLNRQGNHLRASVLSHQFLHFCDRVHNCSMYSPRCPNTPCSAHGVLKCVCTKPLFTLLSNSDLKKTRLKQTQKAGETGSSQISLLLHSFPKAQTLGNLPVFIQYMWLLSVWTLRRVTSRSLKGRKKKRRRGRQGDKREEAEGGCGLQSCAVYSMPSALLYARSQISSIY